LILLFSCGNSLKPQERKKERNKERSI